MGRLDFGRSVAHPVSHSLHNDDGNVVDGDVAEVVHNGLLGELAAKPELALPLRCRWRVPLTRVHNSFGVLLLY